MGQKVNPIGLRLGINRGWDSVWFSKKREYGNLLIEDYKIRQYVNKNVVKAINKNVRSSPRKVNLLLKNIRGKKADIAIRDLSFARQRIASEIKKTVQSAVANAENNNQYDIDNLYIKEAYVGKSIVLKRFRARAKGRASGIKKPYSNLTIILSENNINKEELHGSKS